MLNLVELQCLETKCCKILTENKVLRSLQILYVAIYVLRAEKVAIFVAIYGKYSIVNFPNFAYICITGRKSCHFLAEIATTIETFSARNTYIHTKFANVASLYFPFAFYNISPPNSATLLILTPSL